MVVVDRPADEPAHRPTGAQLVELITAAEAEHAKTAVLAAVLRAEGFVVGARGEQLAEQEAAAHAHVNAARNVLRHVQKTGGEREIACAEAGVDAAVAAWRYTHRSAIDELTHIQNARSEGLGDLVEQAARSWAADTAVTDALRPNHLRDKP